MKGLEFKLKPCPFCGCTPTLERVKTSATRYGYRIMCENADCVCNPTTLCTDTKEEIIEIWNRRANETDNGK